ncbi:hypothetical protein ACN6LL_007344, partial [Streptomyces violaceoruber]
MFTIKARDLAAILDQVAPHRFGADEDANDLDALILDSSSPRPRRYPARRPPSRPSPRPAPRRRWTRRTS